MMRTLALISVVAGLDVGGAGTAAAQADNPAAPGNRIESCENAAKTVRNGHPAHMTQAAIDYLRLCGEDGARTMVLALADSRSETDTLKLERFHYSLDRWRDADIMNAATRLASDQGATVSARVFAVRHLIRLVLPTTFFRYGDLAAGPRVTDVLGSERLLAGCHVSALGSEYGEAAGRPLSSDYSARIRAFLAQMAADPTVPQPVRNASECIRW